MSARTDILPIVVEDKICCVGVKHNPIHTCYIAGRFLAHDGGMLANSWYVALRYDT